MDSDEQPTTSPDHDLLELTLEATAGAPRRVMATYAWKQLRKSASKSVPRRLSNACGYTSAFASNPVCGDPNLKSNSPL
jgi:hypothetical protein